MSQYILAIDQGTTNTKALLVDCAGEVAARGAAATPVAYPRPGWVEQDPVAIWMCTRRAIGSALDVLQDPDRRIVAIGVSNQRETALLWRRKTGRPVGPAVVWQCRRSAAICEALRAAGHESTVQTRTGLQLDPMFSAGKFRWLLDHAAENGTQLPTSDLCAGNVDAWLLWNLTGGADDDAVHATDVTNASRTQLMALSTLEWDPELLSIFGIDRGILPTLRPSSAIFGWTAAIDLPTGDVLPAGIPIAAMIGDSHASLFGLGGFRPGSVKATYGTGTSLMTPTTGIVASTHGLSTTVAWSRQPTDQAPTPSPARSVPMPGSTIYALEGNIYTTGGAVQYVGELLGLEDPVVDVDALARSVEEAGDVVFVPALVGLGAPHWQDKAQGTISGLTLGTDRGQLARAALDAIAFQVRDVFDVMQTEAGTSLDTLLADGGASRNDLLMQIQADILGCGVERSHSSDVSPLGAAFLAGLATGFWSSQDEITTLIPPRDCFEPSLSSEDRERHYSRWQRALQRTLLGIKG